MASVVLGVLLVPSPSNACCWTHEWSLPEQIPGSSGAAAVVASVGRTPLAAADSRGVVTAVWASPELGSTVGLMSMSQRTSDGGWTDAAPVGDFGAQPVALDVGPHDAVTLLVWNYSGLYALRLASGGTWSAPEPVAAGVRFCTTSDVRLDADGPQPIVAWNEPCDATPSRVVASVRGDDGTWSDPTTVSAPDLPASLGDMEVQVNGTATFVWVRRPGSAKESSVWLRERRPDGSWTPRERLSQNGAKDPDLAVEPGFARTTGVAYALVGWVKYARPGVYLPHAATRDNGKWHYKLLDDRGSYGVAVSVTGDSLTAWNTRSALWARGMKDAGLWARVRQVSPEPGSSLRFAGNSLFWLGRLTGGSRQLLLERDWSGTYWGATNALSSSQIYGDFSTTGNHVVFGVYNADTEALSIQAVTDVLVWDCGGADC
jgi:hypothetical protein